MALCRASGLAGLLDFPETAFRGRMSYENPIYQLAMDSTMSFARFIKPFLLITGMITFSPIIGFFQPEYMVGPIYWPKIVDEPLAIFFVQHWSLLVACVGGLLLYSAFRESYRVPVMTAAMIEKAGLVLLVAMNWQHPMFQGLHIAALFDGFCCLAYGLCVWKIKSKGA